MVRLRIPMLLCAALLVSAAVPAVGAPEQRASSTTVNGVYSITFNLNIASSLPAGTTITCRAQMVPGQGGLNLGNPQLAATPVETAAGVATVAGSTAICAAEIPFSWTVTSAQGGVMLSYEIDAVSSSGSTPLLVRSSARQGIGAAFPAAGETASLSFNVTF
jgi:hypothetical protein